MTSRPGRRAGPPPQGARGPTGDVLQDRPEPARRPGLARLAEARPIKWTARFLDRLAQHQTAEQATIIAFNIIYAMFPLALSLTALGGFVVHGDAARAQLLREVRAAFPAQVAKEMADVINTAGSHAGLIGVIGFVSLLWAGSNLFAAIEVSLARIFGVPPRGILQQRAVAVVMILGFSALLVLSVAAPNFAVLAGDRHTRLASPPTWRGGQYLDLFGGWVVSTLMTLMVYLIVPPARPPLRAIWPGAILAGTCLQIITLVFPFYIRYLGGVNRFGDAFSLVFLVMTWSYLLSFILLVGAEIIAFYNPPPPSTRGPARQEGGS